MTESFLKDFITGGAGYMGSYNCAELHNAGKGVNVFDNSPSPLNLAFVDQTTGKKPTLVQSDSRDSLTFWASLSLSGASVLIHFVVFNLVGESAQKLMVDSENYLAGWMNLLQVS